MEREGGEGIQRKSGHRYKRGGGGGREVGTSDGTCDKERKKCCVEEN